MKLHHNQTGIAHLMVPGVLAVLAIVGFAGYRIMHTKSDHPVSTSSAANVAPPSTENTAAEKVVAANDDAAANPNKTFDLVVSDNARLTSGPAAITVSHGDKVRVNIRATGKEAEVKLDGYDIITEAGPSDDTPGGFSFIADQIGTFKFYTVPDIDGGDSATTPSHQLGTITVK